MLELPTRDDIPENAFTVSRSRLATWNKCQYRHYLNYTLEKRSASSGAMQLGTAIHKLLQDYYDFWLGRPVGRLDSSFFLERMDALFIDATYEQELIAMNATRTMARYPEFSHLHDDWIPLGTEVETFAPLVDAKGEQLYTPDNRPIYLHVIIDLIVEKMGQMGFLDHKSGTKFWTPENSYFDGQMLFYFIVLHLLGVEVEFAGINNINTYSYKKPVGLDKLYARQYVYRSKIHIEHQLQNIITTVRQILNLKNFAKNLDQHCAFCPFQDVCDTELRGLDSSGVIEGLGLPELTIDFDLGLVDED